MVSMAIGIPLCRVLSVVENSHSFPYPYRYNLCVRIRMCCGLFCAVGPGTWGDPCKCPYFIINVIFGFGCWEKFTFCAWNWVPEAMLNNKKRLEYGFV